MQEQLHFKSIDLTFLKEFCRDDREKMASYIHLFLESVPDQIEAIKINADLADWEGVKKGAHSLKPQLTFIGAASVEPVIEKIESMASSENAISAVPPLVLHLETLMEQTFNQLIQTLVSLS